MPIRDPEKRKRYFQRYHKEREKTHRRIFMTVSPERYQCLLAYAERHKKGIGMATRDLAITQLDSIPELAPETREALNEIIRLLRSSSNNVNQIAHACNVRVAFTDDPPTAQEGTKILADIHKGLIQLENLIEQKIPNSRDHQKHES